MEGEHNAHHIAICGYVLRKFGETLRLNEKPVVEIILQQASLIINFRKQIDFKCRKEVRPFSAPPNTKSTSPPKKPEVSFLRAYFAATLIFDYVLIHIADNLQHLPNRVLAPLYSDFHPLKK